MTEPDFKKSLAAGRKLAEKIAQRRNVLVTFQIDESLRERANAKAKDCGVNLSEFMRRCIERFIELPIETTVKAAMDEVIDSAADGFGGKKGGRR